MQRLRSPLIALLAAMVLVGPLAGRVTEIDPADPLQVSTPRPLSSQPNRSILQATALWEFDHGSRGQNPELSPVMSLGDHLLLTAPTRLVLLDALTGDEVWDTPLPFAMKRVIWTDENEAGDTFLFIGNDDHAAKIALDSGQVLWTTEIPNITTGFWFHDTYVVSASTIDGKTAIDIRDHNTGLVLWSQRGLDNFRLDVSHMVIVRDSILSVVDLHTGIKLWSQDYTGLMDIEITDNRVVVFSGNELSVRNIETGNELWLNLTEPGYSWRIHPSGSWLIILDKQGVRVIEMATGLEVWAQSASTMVTMLESTVVLGHNEELRAFEMSTGIEQWNLDTGNLSTLQVTDTGNTRWIELETGGIVILNIDTGDVLFSAEVGHEHRTERNTHIFEVNGEIVAIDTNRGTVLWSHAATTEIATLSLSERSVIYADSSGDVTTIDVLTGEAVIRFKVDSVGVGRLGTRGEYILRSDGNEVVIFNARSGEKMGSMPESDVSDISLVNNRETKLLLGHKSIAVLDSTGRRIAYQKQIVSGHLIVQREGASVGLVQQAFGSIGMIKAWDGSGYLRWELIFDDTVYGIRQTLDQATIAVQFANSVLVLDATTGKPLWEAPVPYSDSIESWSMLTSSGLLLHTNGQTTFYGPPNALILSVETVLQGAPNIESVSRGTLLAGSEVLPTGNVRERGDGLWLEVSIDGVTGWVHEDALDSPAATPVATPTG